MTRTAEELMTHHINSMMSMKKDSNLDEALSDYSEELVAITRLDGRTRTMGHDTLTSVMRTSLSFAVKLGMTSRPPRRSSPRRTAHAWPPCGRQPSRRGSCS